MSQDHYLTLSGLAKRYGEAPPVVSDLDLVVQRGEFVTLLGPSGCGKTTTLRMVAGLIEPTGGRIQVDGKDITALPAHRRNMGLVFQSYALFPHMTIARNVAFGLEMRGLDKGEIAGRVREALAMVRLDTLAERRPRELSGGQQQRVALARALVIRPALLLLDEPLSNLDAKLREELREEIRDIQQKLGITALFVTHDQSEALTMSDRVVVMNAGRIEQTGSPSEIYERPATPFVATFIGRTNQIPLTVESTSAAGSILSGPGGRFVSDRLLSPGQETVAMVRPHRITLVPAGTAPSSDNAVTATVRKAVFAGETVTYELVSPSLTLTVDHHTRTLQHGHFQIGDQVVAQWDPADMLAFEESKR